MGLTRQSLPAVTSDPFVHLHVHSNFSFLDGATAPERLLERAAELGMKSLALTDHHGLYGSVRFMQAAAAYGIKPILGVELEVSEIPYSRSMNGTGQLRPDFLSLPAKNPSNPIRSKKKLASAKNITTGLEEAVQGSMAPDWCHLILLARNREGYSSLCRIVTKAQLEHQDDPHISLEALARLAGNLVILTGCAKGAISRVLPRTGSNLDKGLRITKRLIEVFGRENLWVELQHHLLPGDDRRNLMLVEIARQTGLPWVITNNVHYAKPEQYRLRDVMACIQTNTTLEEWTDIRQRNAEYYLKSGREMVQTFSALPADIVRAGLRASIEIGVMCALNEDGSVLATTTRAPSFPVPKGETPFSYLYSLCNAGLRRKYRPMTRAAVNRLAYELDIVEQMDLSEFFLCVWDMVQFSRRNGIRCAGRGSAADSIIAYVLDITTVDPIANNLLFDRFLNPGRVGMPDVDIDFDSRRRPEVIEYIENKYGPEHSAMVANLITYRSRSAFRDVAKVMGYPPGLIDHLASSLSYRSVKRLRDDLQSAGIVVHSGSDRRIQDAPQPSRRGGRGPSPGAIAERTANNSWKSDEGQLPAVSQPMSYGQLDTIIELCEQMDGYPRHLSLHNGGMLITREPLVDVVPIEYATSGVRVCQFNKDDVEALGLIKFDILGLRTLSIVNEAVDMIREVEGIDLAIDDLPLDDPAVYSFICTSKTIGVFQIESPGQWHLLQRAQPRMFGDLIIQIALFRPGPLQGGMVNPYIERLCGREPVTYMHPSLEDALRDTLGVVIFQEQVLQVAHDFAGLSYADADGLRRAMSHYRTDAEMNICREVFVESAVKIGRDRELAEDLYEKLTYFSGYGFCRSHAAAFAKTVYQTAFLKTYFPAEFIGAILSNEPCCYYPTQTVIEEARKWGIPVLPVDINRSRVRYWVEIAPAGERRLLERSETSLRRKRSALAIRMGFIQVKGVSEEAAGTIVEARNEEPFRDIADFWKRTGVDRDALKNLIAVGAFDSLGTPRRQLLWQYEDVIRNTSRDIRSKPAALDFKTVHQAVKHGLEVRQSDQIQGSLALPDEKRESLPLPELPPLSELDLAGLDMTLQNASARYSVMMFYRRSLKEAGIMSIGDVLTKADGVVLKTAGIVISRQQPPTAKGMTFLVLSDEEGELPAAIPPQIYEKFRRTLSGSASLVVEGALQRHRRYVSLMIRKLWNMRDIATLDTKPYEPAQVSDARRASA